MKKRKSDDTTTMNSAEPPTKKLKSIKADLSDKTKTMDHNKRVLVKKKAKLKDSNKVENSKSRIISHVAQKKKEKNFKKKDTIAEGKNIKKPPTPAQIHTTKAKACEKSTKTEKDCSSDVDSDPGDQLVIDEQESERDPAMPDLINGVKSDEDEEDDKTNTTVSVGDYDEDSTDLDEDKKNFREAERALRSLSGEWDGKPFSVFNKEENDAPRKKKTRAKKRDIKAKKPKKETLPPKLEQAVPNPKEESIPCDENSSQEQISSQEVSSQKESPSHEVSKEPSQEVSSQNEPEAEHSSEEDEEDKLTRQQSEGGEVDILLKIEQQCFVHSVKAGHTKKNPYSSWTYCHSFSLPKYPLAQGREAEISAADSKTQPLGPSTGACIDYSSQSYKD